VESSVQATSAWWSGYTRHIYSNDWVWMSPLAQGRRHALRALSLAWILVLCSAYAAAACGCSTADDPNNSRIGKCAPGCLVVCGNGASRVVCDSSEVQPWPQGLGDSKRILALGAVLSEPTSLRAVDLKDLLMVRGGDSSIPLSALLRAPWVGNLAGAPRAPAGSPVSLVLRRNARLDPLLSALTGKDQVN
jgi:hypothetical protein